ncbi:MAG: alcohol dehydrogenase catalytic domain-containing protein [Actinomycetia bacterium]|nr:alcohol dehydrogenase catalytic domain-containing protein [Actinomycetes bacterium]
MLHASWTPEGVELVEGPQADLRAGWARLEVTGCGICGSDLHVYRGMQSGVLRPHDFATPGHEIAGRVVDGPTDMADIIYAVEPSVTCRVCADCVVGNLPLCPDGELLGIHQAGGLAQFVDVPPHLLHPVDDRLDGRLASLAEPWAVAVRGVHRSKLTEIDERVLVLGGGTIGLLSGLAARDRAARVGVTCRYPHQAELARSFGLEPVAPDTVDEWSAEHRPGVVIETVGGMADTMADAIRVARPGGRIVVVGVFSANLATDYRALMLKELEVVGSYLYGTVASGSEFGAAVRSMGPMADELAAFQTHHYALEDLGAAFTTADDKSSLAVKVTIGAA